MFVLKNTKNRQIKVCEHVVYFGKLFLISEVNLHDVEATRATPSEKLIICLINKCKVCVYRFVGKKIMHIKVVRYNVICFLLSILSAVQIWLSCFSYIW